MATERLVEVTRLSRIVENFNAKVRGIDIAVDVEHDATSGAASWFRELAIRPSSKDAEISSIWGLVRWTDFGKEIAGPNKKYQYVSAEFGDWRNPETKEMFKDVLIAATLTNRPFVKGMKPVEATADEEWIELLREGEFYDPYRWGDETKSIKASEIDQRGLARRIQEAVVGFFSTQTPQGEQPQEGDTKVDESKIREILAAQNVVLSDDMSEDDLLAKLTEVLAAKDGKITELEEAAAAGPEDGDDDPDPKTAQLSETNTKLAEQVERMSTKLTEQAEEIKSLKAKNHQTEKVAFFDKVIAAGKLAPAEREAYEKLYEADKDTVVAMLTGREQIVSFSESGSSSEEQEEGDSQDKVIALAEQMVKDEQITFAEATLKVLKQHPELAGDE